MAASRDCDAAIHWREYGGKPGQSDGVKIDHFAGVAHFLQPGSESLDHRMPRRFRVGVRMTVKTRTGLSSCLTAWETLHLGSQMCSVLEGFDLV
jgi:hypothetical protein